MDAFIRISVITRNPLKINEREFEDVDKAIDYLRGFKNDR